MSNNFDTIKNNFIKVYDKDIECDIPINKLYIHNVDSYTSYIYNINDVSDIIGDKLIFKNRFQYSTIRKVIHYDKLMRFSRWKYDTIFYPFSKDSEYLIDKIDANMEYDNSVHFFTNENYTKANVIILVEYVDSQQIKLCYYVSKKIYEPAILNKKTTTSNILIDLLNRGAIESKNKEAMNELNIILNSTYSSIYNDINLNNLNSKLNDNIKLYDYQKSDIIWMKNIKNRIDNDENTITVIYNEFNKVLLRDYYLNDKYNSYLIYNKELLLNADIENNYMNVRYYGGNIISSVGLGKTIITLGYLIDNSINDFDKYICFEDTLCNYFYKRGINKGSSCTKKKVDIKGLYCREHSKTLFIDKRKTILNKNTLENFSVRNQLIEIDYNWRKKKLFKTNASLILCPNQLCDQWVREYYDSFKQNKYSKRVLLIVTYDQYRNITFGEILFADIIIVSYDFLKNANYIRKQKENRYPNNVDLISILNEIDDDFNEQLDDELNSINTIDTIDTSVCRILNQFNSNLNILSNFYYENIICDEFHELNCNIINDTLKVFSSKYKWNITATPFANGIDSFINGISNITDHIICEKYINGDVVKSFSKLFRRNTKESIKKEYTSTIILDTLKILEFTEQERRIYDAHSINKSVGTKDFLIKLCCDTSIDIETKNLVKNCKTLNEIESVILNNNKKKLCNLKKSINEHGNKILKLEKQAELGFVPTIGFYFESQIILTIQDLRVILGNFRRSLTIYKKEYNDINRTYIFLKNAIDNIKTSETCPICLDEITSDIAITKCGHKFCIDCINEYVNEMCKRGDTKCPKCNIFIKLDDIFLLKEDNEISNNINIENDDLNNLIQKVRSTKIGNIIYYVKQSLQNTDKCIIFSQWDTLLSKIGRLLNNEGINPLFCTGTIYQKKKSIKAFQEDPASKIICLSSESCAAGINLTAANKIILVEPVHGLKQHRIDIENQAIGRSARIGGHSNIEVIRFIIKDTIEEDIYNDNEKELNYNIINSEPLKIKQNVIEL